MDGAGDEILAHPTLAAEQHRRVGISDALDHRPDRSHGGAAVEQRGILREITFTVDLRDRVERSSVFVNWVRAHGTLRAAFSYAGVRASTPGNTGDNPLDN